MSPTRLPAWLEDCLPDVVAANVLDVVGSEYVLLSAEGATTLGSDIVEAYDEAGKHGDVKFSDAVRERFGDGVLGMAVPTERGHRLLIDCSDTDRRTLLEGEWQEFLELDQAWRANPDFVNSFHWLNSHPVFWTRVHETLDPSSASWRDAMFWDWKTSGHISQTEVGVTQCDGQTVVWLEAGAHIAEELRYGDDSETPYIVTDAYRSHYHDLRLDVYAPTYESAVTALASKVDKFFHPDGSERENVIYEKSALETELEKRVAELDAAHPRSEPEYPRVKFADLGRGRPWEYRSGTSRV